jgi:predicted RNA-binding protein with PUA-like domain
VAGIARVVRNNLVDPTQFDPASEYFDPKSRREDPTWRMVEIEGLQACEPLLPLAALRAVPELAGMAVLQKGQRLSVQPVSPAEWKTVLKLAGIRSDPLGKGRK